MNAALFQSLHPRLRLALEFLLYVVLTAFALHATWLTWPDAFIDFSRELYLPWRVSCGDVLYRDLPYFFGPLSVYANAALFALLGRPSIHALFVLNFAFWMATLLALRTILRRIASPLAATIAVSSFILLFSFNRYLATGNYNFLAPYTHELPRGFLLALLALLSLDSATHRHSSRLALLSGFFLGFSLFTKPEIALASVVSFFSLLLFWGRGCPNRTETAAPSSRSSLVTCLSSLVSRLSPLWLCAAIGIFAALVLVLAPLSIALRSVFHAIHFSLFRPFLDCLDSSLVGLDFFRRVSGMDRPLFHLAQMAAGVLLVAMPLAAAKLLASPRSTRHLPSSIRFALLSLLCLAAVPLTHLAFWQLNAALPLAPIVFAFTTFRSPNHDPLATDHFRSPISVAFAVFAFVLSLKVILNASISFYGFVLLLPSFLLAVVLAFALRATRPVALAILAAFAVHALLLQRTVLINGRFVPVAAPTAPAAYRTQSNVASYLNHVLHWLNKNLPPGATLAVLPEGAVLNVLSGHPNSTPYVSLPSTDYLRFDESGILRAYQTCPPDYLLLVKKEVLVSDEPRFGIDYAQPLMAFLDANYSPVLTLPVQTPTGLQPFFLLASRTLNPTPPLAVDLKP